MKYLLLSLLMLTEYASAQQKDSSAQLILPNRNIAFRQVDKFSEGHANDSLTGITIGNKFYEPVGHTTKIWSSQKAGIYADGITDATQMLNRYFSRPVTKGLIIEQDATGSVLNVKGVVDCKGKSLRFDGSVIIKGSGTLSNVIIDAPDGIQIFESVSLLNAQTASGYWSPKWFGAKGDSITDDTKALSKMFSIVEKQPQPMVVMRAKYKLNGNIDLSYPPNISIRFERGAMITGSGSFGGGVITASYDQQIWGDSLTVKFYTTDNIYHSVKWFGAKGNGIADDWFALQKAADFNKSYPFDGKSTLYFPIGIYNISKPLLLFNWNGSAYAPVTASWVGEKSTQHGINSRALIKATGAPMGTQMLLGIQIGYQCMFKNLAFEGLYTKPEKISQGNFRNLVNAEYADWKQNGISDKKYAPHACVVLDPFGGTVPPDTGYKALASYYRGALSSGGSSNNEFDGCWFSNTVVGTVVGLTPGFGQSEYNRFLNCSWQSMKIGYATANAQSNNCIISNFECVGWMHHFIDNITYGATSAGSPPFVDKGVVAQGMLYFAAISSAGKPLYANNVFAETLYRIGIFNNIDGGYASISSFTNSTFNLFRYDEIKSADWINLGKVNYTDCNVILVSSGNSIPFRLKLAVKKSDAVYTNGMISQVITKMPSVRNPTQSTYQRFYTPTFTNTATYLPESNYTNNKMIQNSYPQSIYNSAIGITRLKWEELPGVEYEFNWSQPFFDETIYLMKSRSVTVSNTGSSYVKLDATQVKKINIGDILTTDLNARLSYSQVIPELTPANTDISIDEMPVLGLVTSIKGDTVFMAGASRNLPDGITAIGNVYLNYRRELNDMLVYNATSGSVILENVERYVPMSTGQFSFPVAGARIEGKGIVPGTKVISSNASSKTITLSIPADETVVNATSINGSPDVSVLSVYSPKQAAALNPSPAFFINGMKWRWKTKNAHNEEVYNDYYIGNTAFKNQYNTNALRVLDTNRVMQINPFDFQKSKLIASIINNSENARFAVYDKDMSNMPTAYLPIQPGVINDIELDRTKSDGFNTKNKSTVSMTNGTGEYIPFLETSDPGIVCTTDTLYYSYLNDMYTVNGRVWIKSSASHRSKFSFTLPVNGNKGDGGWLNGSGNLIDSLNDKVVPVLIKEKPDAKSLKAEFIYYSPSVPGSYEINFRFDFKYVPMN
ncbi:MAG: hypothetical protein QM802_24065 [Agriterribacter sp.]